MTSSRPSSSAIEAERTLIGSKFIDPNTLADLDIEITAKGLFNKYHQWIWNAWIALELASAAIDKITSTHPGRAE
jgi:replicative DNA helicase